MYIQEKDDQNNVPIYQQICCITFRESSSGPVFGNEIEKKRFLDILLNATKNSSVRIYAYCVLDREGYVLAAVRTEEELERVMENVKENFILHYQKRFPDSVLSIVKIVKWMPQCGEKELLEACMELHMLPIRQGYSQSELDYWWSSLNEYILRYRSGIIYPDILLKKLSRDSKSAVRKMKALHRKRRDRMMSVERSLL